MYTPIFVENPASECAVEVLLKCAQGMEPHEAVLLLFPDINGKTVLHNACWRGDSATPAKLVDFVQQFPSKHFGQQFLSKFILSTNNRDQSVLHSTRHEDTATLLVKSLQSGADNIKLVTHRDKHGKNVLHDAAILGGAFSQHVFPPFSTIKFVDKLMSENEIPCDTLNKMLHQTDNNGDTPIMIALNPAVNTWEEFQFIVDVFELLSSRTNYEETLKSVLDQRNSKGQTVFHLAALLPHFTNKIPILEKLATSAEIVECVHQWGLTDNFGNQALHYLAGRTDTALFVRLLRNMSLKTHIRLMSQRNRAGVTCMDILNRGRMDWNFFNTSLLCGNKTLEVIGHMAYTSNVYRRIAFYLGPKARSIDQFFDFKCNDLLLSVLSVVRYLLNLYDITFSVALNDSADSMPPGSASKLDEVLLSHSHCQTTADKKINSSLVIISHRI